MLGHMKLPIEISDDVILILLISIKFIHYTINVEAYLVIWSIRELVLSYLMMSLVMKTIWVC